MDLSEQLNNPRVMTDWNDFLSALQAEGGSTDMLTSKTGRYPWCFHFLRGQQAQLTGVVVYAHLGYPKPVLWSPPRDWTTEALIKADYAALKAHGGFFNDTDKCLEGAS